MYALKVVTVQGTHGIFIFIFYLQILCVVVIIVLYFITGKWKKQNRRVSKMYFITLILLVVALNQVGFI